MEIPSLSGSDGLIYENEITIVMLSVLTLGLLLGMKHSLEADHIAAVAAVSAGSRETRQIVCLGVLWGIGHSVMLLAGGIVFLTFQEFVPETFAKFLEIIVGVMLVLIGADLVRRLIKERVHFHAHSHGDKIHVHVHSHRGDRAHNSSVHDHSHSKSKNIRAFLIGCVHGLAGTAAIVVLTLGTLKSFWLGIAYILIFCLGSILGMAAMSFVISIPMKLTSRYMAWGYRGLNAAIGVSTIFLGSLIIYDSWL